VGCPLQGPKRGDGKGPDGEIVATTIDTDLDEEVVYLRGID